MRSFAALGPLLVLLGAAPALADVTLLRMASMAPEGTAWAREVRAFARDVESATDGKVRIKFYLGGIAGDERETIQRVRRGQLDGAALSLACSELAPSLRVTRILGLFQRRDEARHVFSRLVPIIAPEMRQAGFALLGISAFGDDIIFSRAPVRSLDDLRKLKPWIWNQDEVWTVEWPQIGVHTVPLSVDDASRAATAGRVDGFLALPTAVLAYQWSSQVRYYTPLSIAYLPACLIIANRVFDTLPNDVQQTIRGAGAKLAARFDEVNKTSEEQLLGGLFQKHGMHEVPVTATFRSEFFEAARRARQQLADRLVPTETLKKVNEWLADFRAEHTALDGAPAP